MYTEESINEVRSAAKAVEVVGEYVDLKKRGVNFVGLCPFHDEKTPSFYVSPAKNIFKCFGCSKGGDPIEFLIAHKNMSFAEAVQMLASKYNISLQKIEGHVYAKPTWKNKTDLNPNVVKWFEGRKISQATLIKAKVTDGLEWMPKANKEVRTIQFNYFRGEELINIKYRDKSKDFKLHKGAELVFYGLESLKDKTRAVIVEGEPDRLALIEVGLDVDWGLLSVPNGASKVKNNLTYVDNCAKDIEEIEEWIIAVDDDVVGRILREELALRLGKDKCKFIAWGEKKDANGVLMGSGVQGVLDKWAEKQNFPVEGAFTISDISNDIDDMYLNGLDKGVDLKIPNFDLNIVKKYLTGVGGIPSHGKTSGVDYIALNLIRFADWKGAFYSPENRPIQLHFSNLASQLIGKSWEGPNRMTIQEKQLAKDYLDKKLWFVKPEKDFSLDSILNHVSMLVKAYGISFFVIDAWNKLEHKRRPGENETDYVSRSLDQILLFCELNNVHCFLIVHPTKMKKDKFGKYEVPTLYDLNGSSNFYNKLDNGICFYRDFDTGETKIFRQKIKFKHWGSVGYSTYKFMTSCNRYYVEGFPDFKNWITGEINVIDAPISKNEQEAQQQIYFEGDDEPPF